MSLRSKMGTLSWLLFISYFDVSPTQVYATGSSRAMMDSGDNAKSRTISDKWEEDFHDIVIGSPFNGYVKTIKAAEELISEFSLEQVHTVFTKDHKLHILEKKVSNFD